VFSLSSEYGTKRRNVILRVRWRGLSRDFFLRVKERTGRKPPFWGDAGVVDHSPGLSFDKRRTTNSGEMTEKRRGESTPACQKKGGGVWSIFDELDKRKP